MDPEIEDFLEHFGVKGMQWGKRTSHHAPALAAVAILAGAAYLGSKRGRRQMSTVFTSISNRPMGKKVSPFLQVQLSTQVRVK